MRKKMFFKLLIFAVLATFVTFTSCKDYDDEIKILETGLASLKSTVEEMQQKIEGGSTITGVETTTNGLVISLSDGRSYTLTNGTDGEDGSVVTIGSNGNWFIDGTDTNKPSQGADGEDGKDGIYFIPGEDGFWHEVDGETVSPTTDSWIIEGTITAVWEDGYVILYNVEGADEPIAIGLVRMNNLVLIPNLVTADGSSLMNFNTLITSAEAKLLQTTVQYQVSPINATEKLIDKENLYFKINNPDVLTLRATSLDPKVEFISLESGILTVSASIDADVFEALNEDGEKMVQLMLAVPLITGDEVVSGFAKVVAVDVTEIVPAISVSPESLDMLSDTGEDITLTIDANNDEWEISNLPDWLTLKEKTATSLTLTAAPNAGAKRTASLTFHLVAYPEVTKVIDVTQAAKVIVDGPGSNITDVDGNEYNTVWIGGTQWMAENLRTTHYNDGTPISNLIGDAWANNTSVGAYGWYNNNQAGYKERTGGYYNWLAVNSNKLCPTGWRVPSDSDWDTLIEYLGFAEAGGKLKETGTANWSAPNTGATNETGFTAVGAGHRWHTGASAGLLTVTYFWSSTETSGENANAYYLGNTYPRMEKGESYNKVIRGLSVRCIRE